MGSRNTLSPGTFFEGRNVDTIHEQRFHTLLDTMWPEWRTERAESHAAGLRFLEMREFYLAGVKAYGDRNWAPPREQQH